MSNRKRRKADRLTVHADLFAALGDQTRLALLGRLSVGGPQSIAALTGKTNLTRQAVTKHLRVLEEAGAVRSVREGRENIFAYDPAGIDDARAYLDEVARCGGDALARSKVFVDQ